MTAAYKGTGLKPPSLPVRGATAEAGTYLKSMLFQSTLPVGGATAKTTKNAG